MRISYDKGIDAAYLDLTSVPLLPGRETVACPTPGADAGVDAIINLDFKDGKLVGLEVLDASRWLHRDLLDAAE